MARNRGVAPYEYLTVIANRPPTACGGYTSLPTAAVDNDFASDSLVTFAASLAGLMTIYTSTLAYERRRGSRAVPATSPRRRAVRSEMRDFVAPEVRCRRRGRRRSRKSRGVQGAPRAAARRER